MKKRINFAFVSRVRKEDCLLFILVGTLLITGFIVPLESLLTPVLVSVPILLAILLLIYAREEPSIFKASISWVLLGTSLLFFSVFGEEHISNKSFAVFLSSFAAVFVSLGLINIVLQLKDTKEYFANALSDLVVRESYIAKAITHYLTGSLFHALMPPHSQEASCKPLDRSKCRFIK
ncbi:MAG: hypothetical protein WCA63_03285 [Gallionella sp.]